MHEEYQYLDPDHGYTYPQTNVLRNNLNIYDEKELEEKEHELVTKRIMELMFDPIEVYSLEDIRSIHHYLFQDIYDWAGIYRTVNISKQGTPFMSLQSFDTGERYINSLIENFHHDAHSEKEIIHHLAEVLDNLNYMHPFREGNGRTQREAIRSLATSKGCNIRFTLNDIPDMYELYMQGTIRGEVPLLVELFNSILEYNSRR